MPPVSYRYLRGYTIDPGFSTQLDTMGINEMVYQVKWEPLAPGPIGEYLEVIDFDPPNDCFYEPVDLDSTPLLSQQGLQPSEGAAQFHQQFVYVVMMQTIENFEKALGRKVIWRQYKNETVTPTQYEYVHRLRVYPHAMREANAFYTQEKMAILFGYFEAGTRVQGANFPGGVVFACLSPDIIAHETTHAILDSIHPRYLENTNPDVPAFHEAFSDIVALLQRFSNTRLIEHQLERTRGRLDEYSLLGELATQFGQATATGRGALRSAIGKFNKTTGVWEKIAPDPAAYQTVFEPHARGAILVATVFDAFMRLYNFRVKDLLRIATQGTGVLPLGSIHPDLVKRLAAEAAEIAAHLLSVCIRALDYCPPFDITYGSYLRAMITADVDICAAENNYYRVSLIEAFRAWGIFPEQVNTLSVYSLCWSPPELTQHERTAMSLVCEFLQPEIRKILGLKDRKEISDAYNILQARLQKLLVNPATANPRLYKAYKMTDTIWKNFLLKLGIVFDPFSLEYEGTTIDFKSFRPLEVHSIRPAFRVGRDNMQMEQVIVTLTQTQRVDTGDYDGLVFRGGCTIILSVSQNNLNADYIIVKNAKSTRRLAMQLDYQLRKTAGYSFSDSMYDDDAGFNKINFEKLHFH